MNRLTNESISTREYYRRLANQRELSHIGKVSCLAIAFVCRLGAVYEDRRSDVIPPLTTGMEVPFDVEGELEAERTNWDPLEGSTQ